MPKALVLVGHSFGSAISAAALTVEPGLTDGVVLTGETRIYTYGPVVDKFQVSATEAIIHPASPKQLAFASLPKTTLRNGDNLTMCVYFLFHLLQALCNSQSPGLLNPRRPLRQHQHVRQSLLINAPANSEFKY